MKTNIGKCDLLIIGYNNFNFPYTLGDVNITSKVSCKDLGVHVSKDLSFSKHCGIIFRNAHFRRRQFQQSFSCKDIDFSIFIFLHTYDL